VDNPSNSPADAAYGRALAAFQEKSYDVARRWAVEALAHNRQHAGARALMARLDAARFRGQSISGPRARLGSYFDRSNGSHQSRK
jgi:hypothetical protein